MKFFIKCYVSVFGLGFIRFAPGTIGSLFAILIWYIFNSFLNILYFYLLFALIFITIFKITKIYLSQTDSKDPSEVIIDEFIGQSIPLLFIYELNIFELIVAFSTFRLFDIFKIYPVNKAEKIKGEFGVILDDIIAGIYSLIFVLLFRIIFSI